MDPVFDHRIARIVSRQLQAKAASDSEESQADRERRHARDRVIEELPHVTTKISDVLGELNDLLAENAITLTLTASGHRPTAEAVYTIEVEDSTQDGPKVKLNVDYHGIIWGLLTNDYTQSLIDRTSVFTLDRNWVTNIALTLLEAYYP